MKIKTTSKTLKIKLYGVRFFPTDTRDCAWLGLVEAKTKKQAYTQASKKFNLLENGYAFFSVMLFTDSMRNTNDMARNIIKWLSEGQQGYYTPTGLVKELP